MRMNCSRPSSANSHFDKKARAKGKSTGNMQMMDAKMMRWRRTIICTAWPQAARTQLR